MAADGSSPQLITEVDDKPLAPITTALLREAQASQPFFVTELKTPRALHLAFAAAAGGKNGTYVAYAEEPLPANRRITEPAGSPVASLNLAVYLGRSQARSALLETNSPAPLPLSGTTDTTRIPFGNTVLTITTSPRESLPGTTGEILPSAVAGGALLITLLAALLTERLIAGGKELSGWPSRSAICTWSSARSPTPSSVRCCPSVCRPSRAWRSPSAT